MCVPHVCMADTYIYIHTYIYIYIYIRSEVKSLSCAWLFATPWTVYIYIHTHTPQPHTCICIHSSFVGQVGCFHIFAVVNSAAMNIVVNVSFWIIALSGYMPRSGIANSYGNFLVFLRILHTFFHSGCINSHQQCMRFRFLYPLTSICYL